MLKEDELDGTKYVAMQDKGVKKYFIRGGVKSGEIQKN